MMHTSVCLFRVLSSIIFYYLVDLDHKEQQDVYKKRNTQNIMKSFHALEIYVQGYVRVGLI